MNLYDEEQRKKEKNANMKINKIVKTMIVITIVIIAGLLITIVYLKTNPNKLTINVDGTENTELSKIITIEKQEDNTYRIYAPIKDFAKVVGYIGYSGEYGKASENKDIYSVVKENTEVAKFFLNSNIIYKKDLTIKDAEYEAYDIESNVFSKDGVLCADMVGLEKGFDVMISYDSAKKILDIYTLDLLVENAKYRAINKYNHLGVDEKTFANKKAVLDNMIVVTSGQANNLKYGVINFSTGGDILGLKYEGITYIATESAFFVKMNGKVGIIDVNGNTKIEAKYDYLRLIDKEKELYLAKNNDLYGVIDINGNTIVDIRYEEIGVNTNDFEQNDIISGCILVNNLIPVRLGEKWAFFDTKGKQVTELKYDKIGCLTTQNISGTYNLLIIPVYKLIVVKLDDKYTFIDSDGNEILGNVLSDTYMEISGGKPVYYMVRDGISYNILNELEKRKS